MLQQTPTQAIITREAASLKSYTLSEAAGYLEVREDDLTALLLNASIVVDAEQPLIRLTHADVELLERLIRAIKRLSGESVYGGGDL